MGIVVVHAVASSVHVVIDGSFMHAFFELQVAHHQDSQYRFYVPGCRAASGERLL